MNAVEPPYGLVAHALQQGTQRPAVGQAQSGVEVEQRFEREAPFGQPRTADLKKAAEAAGLVFLDLPFSGPRATPEQVRAFADLLAERPGRVVAYCKSGMRSSLLWGAAAIAGGRSLEEVLGAALRAGQNLEPVGETMMALARTMHR